MDQAAETAALAEARKAALQRLNAASQFDFRGGGRSEQLRMLGHLLRYSDLQLILIGPTGAGKTQLLRVFADAQQRGLRNMLVGAVEFMGIGALSEAMQRSMGQGISLQGTVSDRIQALCEYGRQLADDGVLGAVLVDDAHLLSAEALEFLIDVELAARETGGLRFVLSGDESLREHLRHSRLIDRLQGKCHYLEIEPMNRDAAMDFMAQCLQAVGLGSDLFSSRELQRILDEGHGRPGALLQAARQVLKGAPPATKGKRPPISLKMPSWHWWALGTVGLLIMVAVLVEPDAPQPDEDEQSAVVVRKVDVPVIVQAQREVRPLLGAGTPLADRTDKTAAVPEAQAAVKPKNPVPVPEVVANAADSAAAALTDAGSGSTGAPAPEAGDRRGAGVPADAPAQEVAVRVEETAEESARKAAREAFLAERERPPARPPAEQWLLEQAPESYTVQMLGTYARDSADEFVAKQPDPKAMVVFETTLSGKPWYVVVSGVYPDRNAAVAAIRGLPDAQRSLNPWARNLASLQKAILDDRPN